MSQHERPGGCHTACETRRALQLAPRRTVEREAAGAFSYDVTASATMADGTMLYTDFIPVTVTPAMPVVTAWADINCGCTVYLTWPCSDLAESYDLYISRDGGDYSLYAAGIVRSG